MIQHFEVIPARRDYKGDRYFRVDTEADKVIQVTLNQGEAKKGRPACFGIGLIGRITFHANYLEYGLCEGDQQREIRPQV